MKTCAGHDGRALSAQRIPGHGAFHQGRLLGTCQKPAPLLSRRRIDATTDVGQELWRVLNFIEDGGKAQVVEKAAWILMDLGQGVSSLDKVVPVSHARVAESCKLLENVFRSVNIALVNELKMAFTRMGIDVWEVIAAASTKPFGYMPFYPGPGLGGHCIPLDPFYLSWKAAEYGLWTRFIELAGEINTEMPHYVVSRLIDALNGAGKALRGARVLVAGLSYKANVDDTRESPSFELIERLRAGGAVVEYCDPYFPEVPPSRKHDLSMTSLPLTREAFATFDAVLLATAHDQFKDPKLWTGLPLVVDTRNMIEPLFDGAMPGPARLVKA
jgi:UDP-N-acetyl-D-glucosamine dehydrogenase